MKKLLLGMACATVPLWSISQVVTDTVSIGAGYADQVWYNLEDGSSTTAAKDEWDFAFEINGIQSSIRINDVVGHELYRYPGGDTGSWNNIDTNGMSGWTPGFNSDTSWAIGAFNGMHDSGDPFDLGWGIYNIQTHHVTGDSLFILKTGAGAYKKLWIKGLVGGTYTFAIADLDGSNEIERTVIKGDFQNRNFGYYSIDTDNNLDREPATQDWDLLFTQYGAVIPGFGAYPATGVLQNNNVHAAQVYPVNDVTTYNDFASASFSSEINTIGFGWKSIDFGTGTWNIADSTVYFVERAFTGEIYKLVFTGFGGSADGNYIFTREKVQGAQGGTAVADVEEEDFFMKLYPNPAAAGDVNLVYSLKDATQAVTMTIMDLHGKRVREEVLPVSNGLTANLLPTANLASGMYLVSLTSGSERVVERLVIK